MVVTTFDHAHFLAEALDSIAAQTITPDEVVVIDDGSHDDPAAVAARYPFARLIRQENAGLAAARNTGLAAIGADYVVFLDADDMLCPMNLEANLQCFATHPDAAFVYGAHDRVDADGRVTMGAQFTPVGQDAHATLLRRNVIGMHAAVLYSVKHLRAIGGFDPSLRACEDYDVYLNLSRENPVACHDLVIARYRIHSANMSADPVFMLHWVLEVQARQRPSSRSRRLEAWKGGRRAMRAMYADVALDGNWGSPTGGSWRNVLRMLPHAPRRMAGRLARSLLGLGRVERDRAADPTEPA